MKQSEAVDDAEWLTRVIGAAVCDYLARINLDQPPKEHFDWFIAFEVLAALRRRGWTPPTTTKKGKK